MLLEAYPYAALSSHIWYQQVWGVAEYSCVCTFPIVSLNLNFLEIDILLCLGVGQLNVAAVRLVVETEL